MRSNFVSTSLPTSRCGMCFLIPLHSYADPFECAPCAHDALPPLLLYYESVRLPIPRTISSPLLGLLMASREIGLALPGSNINNLTARRGLRPRHVSMHSPYRAYLFRLQSIKNLGLRATRNISGLNTFTCVTADDLLPSGFMQSVAVLHAEFRTELVVSLYSGWIVQLVYASFAWRTLCVFYPMGALREVPRLPGHRPGAHDFCFCRLMCFLPYGSVAGGGRRLPKANIASPFRRKGCA